MQHLKIKTLVLASLLAVAPAAVLAQTSNGAGGAVSNFDTGISGGTSGLISGGGTVSSSLDANVSPSRSKASGARTGADANAGTDIDKSTQVKGRKHRASDRTTGFGSIGTRRNAKTRD
jgi:hypothetical protein